MRSVAARDSCFPQSFSAVIVVNVVGDVIVVVMVVTLVVSAVVIIVFLVAIVVIAVVTLSLTRCALTETLDINTDAARPCICLGLYRKRVKSYSQYHACHTAHNRTCAAASMGPQLLASQLPS